MLGNRRLPSRVDPGAAVEPEAAPRSGAVEARAPGLARLKPSLLALGVVYGDIGTSPLYSLRECFDGRGLRVALPNVLGVLSRIFWFITSVPIPALLEILDRGDHVRCSGRPCS